MNKNGWIFPAVFSLLFGMFSLWVILSEGLFGFIPQHTQSGWGVQVGVDLVVGISLGLFFAAPEAKKYGINPWPYVGLTLLTGSIGFFAFAARILYVRSRTITPPAPLQT
jgi:hypothetical protein